MRRSSVVIGAALAMGLAFATEASAQKVVVSHDEWFSYGGYFGLNEQTFVSNTLDWFGLGGSGNILLYSGNTFLTNATFQNYLTGLGYAVTVDAAPASFAGYSAIFSEGVSGLDGSGLASYASGGGNVVYIGGTGIGGAAAEAAYSNTFLNGVGLSFASSYNGVGTANTSGFAAMGPFGAPLFTGVSSIFGDNGQNISASGSSSWTTQVFSDAAGRGLYAAAELSASPVPEPGTLLLMLTGLLALVPVALRRRREA